MTQLTQALSRALSCPHVAQSFATLDRHAASGTFDPERARKLLRNNARDHTRFTPSATRDALADALLDAWIKRNDSKSIAPPGVARYIARHN